jgi:peptidoglycan/LPS O-acetylase OafA/YrhL
VAGVPWTLPYEWLFYLCLPLLSVAIGAIPSIPVLLIGIMGALGCILFHPELRMMSFVSGIVAALLVRRDWFRQIAATRMASVISAVSILMALTLFPKTYAHFALLSLGFVLIAGGATLFGALSNPLSRMLGEMTYSLYLLHGLFLFTLFNFVIGKESAALLSPLGHWLVISLSVPFLILICFTTFTWIEKPAIQCTRRVTAWIRYAILLPKTRFQARN